MGLGNDLKKDQLLAVAVLVKGRKSNKEISSITGILLCSVQRETKHWHDAGSELCPGS